MGEWLFEFCVAFFGAAFLASTITFISMERKSVGEACRASEENAQLRAVAYQHPGDLHWLADDPELSLECWSWPVDEGYDTKPGDVHKVLAAASLPPIFVTTRVLTVDEDGGPDDTEPAWFASEDEAQTCYPDSLAKARATLAGHHATDG